MALVGKWGCFVHVPKTGGQWVRAILRQTTNEKSWEDGPVHGHPIEYSMEKPHFSFVREPIFWYRSFWGHRFRDSYDSHGNPGAFKMNTNDSEAWNTLMKFTLPYMSTDFDVFIDQVTKNLPGIYTWYIGFYYAPHVNMMPFEYKAHSFLKALGGRPDNIDPANKGIDHMGDYQNLWPDPISEESRHKIRVSEARIYQKWYSVTD